MNLLIIKSKDQYFRFMDDSYETCPMNKASVFPVDHIAKVKARRQQLLQDGITDAAIYRLTIREEPFEE